VLHRSRTLRATLNTLTVSSIVLNSVQVSEASIHARWIGATHPSFRSIDPCMQDACRYVAHASTSSPQLYVRCLLLLYTGPYASSSCGVMHLHTCQLLYKPSPIICSIIGQSSSYQYFYISAHATILYTTATSTPSQHLPIVNPSHRPSRDMHP
jgi:hypothetical protein